MLAWESILKFGGLMATLGTTIAYQVIIKRHNRQRSCLPRVHQCHGTRCRADMWFGAWPFAAATSVRVRSMASAFLHKDAAGGFIQGDSDTQTSSSNGT